MSLKACTQMRGAGCRQQSSSRSRTAVVPAATRPQHPSTSASAWGSNSFAAAVIAAGASATLLLSQVQPAAAASSSLADILRPEFGFVDKNKDGKVSMDEMVEISKEVAAEEDFAVPPEEQLAFAMRLFDLNQDGTVTLDETLQALALDAGVSEDAVDSEVLDVFDSDRNGTIDQREFSQGMPDIGRNGEAVKSYVFQRVDQLGDGDGKLDITEFGNAFSLVRSVVLGY